MEEEIVHKDAVHAPVHERKEYRRKWMAKKREEDRLKKEQTEDRSGGVDASECPVEPVDEPVGVSVARTKADAKFEEQRPGYWIYGKEVFERECWKCGEKFETRLSMSKFCSPKCKEDWLSMTFGKLKRVSQ